MSLPWSSKGVKATPVNADELMILDSADANPSTVNKRITIGSLPTGTISPLTTKGDVYTFDTSDQRLPVGADGQILSADSVETTGLKWIPVPDSGVTSINGDTTAAQIMAAGTGLGIIDGGATHTYSIDGTVVTLTGVQTLTNKTLTLPVISDFTNSVHDHSNTVGGGQLTNSALLSGVFSSITGVGVQSQTLNMGSNFIQAVTDPVNDSDAATKSYVDSLTDSLSWKNPAVAATTGNISLSGNQLIDGILTVDGDRVLVKDQTSGSQNGLYASNTGAWSRTTDADSEDDLINMSLFIEEGNTQADTQWVLTTDRPITVNTTPLTYVEVDASILTTKGDIFGYDTANARIPVGTDGQILTADSAEALGVKWETPSVAGQTPWVSDIDADGFDLTDLSNIEFRNTTGSPAGTSVAIYRDSDDLRLNVATGDGIYFNVNDNNLFRVTDSVVFCFTDLNLNNGDNITQVGRVSFSFVQNWIDGASGSGLQARVQTGQDFFITDQTGGDQYFFNSTRADFGGNNLTNVSLTTSVSVNNAISWADGVKQTFNPNATNAGLNFGAQADPDPTSPVNGDVYYNSTNNKFRAYENSVWVDMIGGGGSQTPWTSNIDGAGFALLDSNYIEVGSSLATPFADAGTIRMPEDGEIAWRNSGDDGNLIIFSSGDELNFEGFTTEVHDATGNIDYSSASELDASDAVVRVDTLEVNSYIFRTGTVASIGTIRLSNQDSIYWRNLADDDDYGIVSDDNNLSFNGWETIEFPDATLVDMSSSDLDVVNVVITGGLDMTDNAIVDFSFITSVGAGSPADAGTIRLGNTQILAWRDFGDAANITLSVNASDQFVFNSALTVGNNVIKAVDTPVDGTDAANKTYVDNLVNGLSWKNPAEVATTGNITLSGEQTIDGVLTSTSRVLVKDQTSGQFNGVYDSAAGAWTRTTDTDSEADLLNMSIYISQGSTQADTAWVLITDAPIVVDTTVLTYAQVGAGIGNPLTTKGDVFGYDTANARIPVGTDGQVLTANSAVALGVDYQSKEFVGPWTANHDAGGFNLINLAVLESNATNVSSVGTIRLGDLESIGFRNSTNDADYTIVSDDPTITFNGWETVEFPDATIIEAGLADLQILTIDMSGDIVMNSNSITGIGGLTIDDGVRITFNPNATNAGLNVGAQADPDPTSPVNGDIYYNSTNNKFRAYENSVWVDMIGGGGGSGDVVGPGSSTDNAITRFDGVTGKLIQNSGVIINDTNTVTVPGPVVLTAAGTVPSGTETYFREVSNDLIVNVNGANDVDFNFGTTNRIKFTTSGIDLLTNSLAQATITSTSSLNATQVLTGLAYGNGIKQVFNPSTSNAGINVGEEAGTPSAPVNGDLYYQTSVGLRARIEGAWVELGTGTGDVVGPGSSTDNAIAIFNSTTGKLIQQSGASAQPLLIDDNANLSGIRSLQPVASNTFPAASVAYFQYGNNGQGSLDFEWNVLTGNKFRWTIQGTQEYDFTATEANFRTNNIVQLGAYHQMDAIASPGNSGNAIRGRIFMDSGNSNHLTIRRNDGIDVDLESGGGTGDVVGPASSTDDAFCTFNGVTGKLIQESTVVATLSVAGEPTWPRAIKWTNFNSSLPGTGEMYIQRYFGSMRMHVPTTEGFDMYIDGSPEYIFNATQLNMQLNDLDQMGAVIFHVAGPNTGGLATDPYIQWEPGLTPDAMRINVPSATELIVSVNDVEEYTFSSSILNGNGNLIQNFAQATIESSAGGIITIENTQSSPAPGTTTGYLRFVGDRVAASAFDYGKIEVIMGDTSSGSADGEMMLMVGNANTENVEYVTLNEGNAQTIHFKKNLQDFAMDPSTGTAQINGLEGLVFTDDATILGGSNNFIQKHTDNMIYNVETGDGHLFTINGTTEFSMSSTALDVNGNDVDNIQNLIHDISASGTDIDFDEDELQTISISANTVFTTANRASGRSKVLKITTDGTLRTLTFPGWDWTSAIPADQAANKNGYLTLTCFSTTDASIVASYIVGSL